MLYQNIHVKAFAGYNFELSVKDTNSLPVSTRIDASHLKKRLYVSGLEKGNVK
jgi:hypothetical protein